MQNLSGEYRCVMDDKGRLNFPFKLRDGLGEKLVVARWMEKCLAVFPEAEWDKNAQRFEGQGLIKYRNLRRLLYGGKIDVTPDKQGRVSITNELRRYAGLEKEVMVVGVGSYVEIWNVDAWQETTDSFFDEDNMAALEGLDF